MDELHRWGSDPNIICRTRESGGLPAQIRETQVTESIGTSIWLVRPSCLVSTLSNSGEVIAEETIPASSIVAPMNPEVLSEYPCGVKYWDVRIEKVFTLQRISLRYVNP